MTAGYVYQWSTVLECWRVFLAGAWMDLWASGLGFSIACAIGLLVAFCRMSSVRFLAFAASVYVEIGRGIPPYVLLLWIHFGVARLTGVSFTPVQSILAVLAITGGGYAAEVFRSGIAAVERGQVEAAKSLGLNRIRVQLDVVLPQALRIVIPPLLNVLIGVLKTSTLMGVIAVPDLLYAAQDLNMSHFIPFEAFTAVLIIFVSLVFTISLFVLAIERALAYP
jgi:His/Glu/Gln/Arg/opine family amino acid ABC transporter permease subunit